MMIDLVWSPDRSGVLVDDGMIPMLDCGIHNIIKLSLKTN